jgi:gliding motility-associatede transport system auxiliary component
MAFRVSPRWQLRLVNASFVLLFLVAVGLLQWLAGTYKLQFDMTQNARHTLAPASVAAVERLKEPLTVTAYASAGGQLRSLITDFVARYQKYKPDIRLEFVDPDTAPERARAAGVEYDGELVLAYGEARETVPPNRLTEENFTNALTRLGHRGERWLVFLSGHGEANPDRQANFDLSLFASELHKRGFKTRTLALSENPQIPQNTSALVIANPRVRLLPGEVREIADYLKRGGNLLWMQGPGPLAGTDRIAEALGIEFQPGVIVDPASQKLVGLPTAVIIANYGNNPAVRDFPNATLFPYARGLSLASQASLDHTPDKSRTGGSDGQWHSSVLFDTRPSSWAETGRLEGTIRFDSGKDIKGPLNIGVALTRETGDAAREQRVIVIGDGDFLSNRYLGNVGNLELGMSLVNWLSRDDAYVNIPVRTARDRSLSLSHGAQIAIAALFLAVLPLGLAGSGIAIWLRRRKR